MSHKSFDLPDDLERFIHEEVALGRFSSLSEVVEAGLLLLQEREIRLAALRSLIAQSEHPETTAEQTVSQPRV
jgi:antitoxin ParD1/3/4